MESMEGREVGLGLDGDLSTLDLRYLPSNLPFAGANAITQAGEIVNLDGTANRVGAISFGPKRVLIVAGQNKIVEDIDAGIARVRDIAAPLNSKRLKLGNPCEKDGKCHDYAMPTRICRVWSIVEGQMNPQRMVVLIVQEDLGM